MKFWAKMRDLWFSGIHLVLKEIQNFKRKNLQKEVFNPKKKKERESVKELEQKVNLPKGVKAKGQSTEGTTRA